MASNLPHIVVRGDVVYADLRRATGDERYRHVCLDLPAGSSEYEIGIAVGQHVAELRAAGRIKAPELRGLHRDSGVTLADAILSYLDGRQITHKGNRRYVHGLCGRISRHLGHMPISDLDGRAGTRVLLRWVELLRTGKAAGLKKPLGGHTVQNYIYQLAAVLQDALDAGQLAAMPKLPRELQDEPGPVYVPKFEHWVEADFRKLREEWAEEILRVGGWTRFLGPDREVWRDYIAKRKLYLSMAYYTGLHTGDLDRVPAEWLSWEVGRYRRENTKSARCVRPAVFDMPEQLQLDCEAEARRCQDLGKPWRPEDLVCGGSWPRPFDALNTARLRLWPDPQNRPPHFNFRLCRRSTAWEYCIRGWQAEQIAAILGHVDRKMVEEVYRRCDQLGLISPVRLPWTIGTAPKGADRTGRATVLAFRKVP